MFGRITFPVPAAGSVHSAGLPPAVRAALNDALAIDKPAFRQARALSPPDMTDNMISGQLRMLKIFGS